MRTKRHYCAVGASPLHVQLGSSNGAGVHLFLLDEQSSKMNSRMPRPAVELIAILVITVLRKRYAVAAALMD